MDDACFYRNPSVLSSKIGSELSGCAIRERVGTPQERLFRERIAAAVASPLRSAQS